MYTLITGNKGYIASGLFGDGFDIKDGEDVCSHIASKPYDVIIHAAARISVVESKADPFEYVRTNVMGTLNMLLQYPKAHFIYLSTVAVYGEGKDLTVSSPLNPLSLYASTKLAGELLVRQLAKSFCILRLTNVIGKGVRGIPSVLEVFDKEKILPIYGDGQQTRDFVSVDFVREVIHQSVGRRGIYNVGSGESVTVLDVARSFGKPVMFLDERPGEIRRCGLKQNAINNITELQGS